MQRRADNRAWFAVAPVVVVVAFTAIVPLMTVVNYSVQDIFDVDTRLFIGFDFYRETLRDPRFAQALLRQLAFSALVLAIEIPLGIWIARALVRNQGKSATGFLILLSVPLLVPWNVVGTIWQIYARPDIGLLGAAVTALGIPYNYASNVLSAWVTLLAMDVWHWTSLVALLSFAGLSAISPAYYQAATLDGANAWQTFRHVELPHLKAVLTIAVLLRLMDSLMIYTEPFVLTGGGPGNSTTFLSQYLTTMAVGQFDLGPAAAFSVLYFLMILLLCWLFYTSVMRGGDDG
ncbi:MAG: sugar ABC transporter permease [Pseudomonadales bacterium]|jgi:glycerol transport system permease protein|nr:sugar ABC transporter permease [Pseudomonadales bacterium]MDP6471485.1 sugar ABC transporter permease [Pseudomonadales bacterium]MDP6828655.1 sugar ABC transporter permease [Pseudomonadales bacterium]MDP6972373.1 sugar ABC transporter permease [Pseudomonadales bacterium]|tara:strand:- start:6865 stop:7734 length:870 start_codon:yes stop_codon:yes gene_type:complete